MNKQTNFKKFSFLLIVGYVLNNSIFSYKLSVPKIANNNNLGATKEFAENFESFAKEFSKSYSDSMAFSAKLGEQIGLDSIDVFPRFLIGFNMGVSFGKTKGLAKNEATKKLTRGAVPEMLPTLNPVLYLGTGINELWDIRLKIFPTSKIAMPESITKSEKMKTSIKMGAFGLSSKYHLLPRERFRLGISLGGNICYYKGEIEIAKEKMEAGDIISKKNNSAVINGAEYSMKTSGSWSAISFGPEIKTYLDLMFIIPYVGYGISFNVGKFTTALDIDGKIQIESDALEDSSLGLKVKKTAYATPLNHRLLLGLEFSIFIVKLGFETVVNLRSRTVGVNFGVRLQF